MHKNLEFYNHLLSIYKQEYKKVNSNRILISIFRMITFFGVGFVFYFLYPNYMISIPISVLFLVAFFVLVNKHNDFKHRTQFIEKLIEINDAEIKAIEKNSLHFPSGRDFLDIDHDFANDIDLFGDGSFYQYLNRTSIREGSDELVRVLLSNHIESIEKKQKFIQDLSKRNKFRQEFQAHGKMLNCDIKISKILAWLTSYKLFINKFWFFFSYIFSFITIVLITLSIIKIISFSYVGLMMTFGLFLVGVYNKKIIKILNNSNKLDDTFYQYSELLRIIENENFNFEIFPKKINKNYFRSPPSSLLYSFSKKISSLNNRNNIFIGIFGNALFLRDFRAVYYLEKWIHKYKKHVEHWFDLVHFFDAWNSFGTFAFNHNNFVYPIIDKNSDNQIKALNLGHPIIKESVRVDSDFIISNNGFIIVTGANMAGKSTFLRTIALTVLMSNIGLPVCASEINYKPTKLITSMRTSDSLHHDESFFFSELKRLKFIVDKISKTHYLILLDEILKGTNSIDKANGSAKFIEKLIKLNCTGIIATHDLSLCELEKQYSEIKNQCFEAQIKKDELFFDYKLKAGICQNMNASFLLKKMNLVDS